MKEIGKNNEIQNHKNEKRIKIVISYDEHAIETAYEFTYPYNLLSRMPLFGMNVKTKFRKKRIAAINHFAKNIMDSKSVADAISFRMF